MSDLVIFIFRKKVATFHCTLKEDWSGEFCGHFHAVLTNEGTHFPGILLMTNSYFFVSKFDCSVYTLYDTFHEHFAPQSYS